MRRVLLIVITAISLLLSGLIALAVCAMIAVVYAETPELNYKNATITITALNVIPVMLAMLSVIRFAVNCHRESIITTTRSRLFKSLKDAFCLQAAYSFISVVFLGQLLDVGPAFIMLITLFVVFVSLMLALLFHILDETCK